MGDKPGHDGSSEVPPSNESNPPDDVGAGNAGDGARSWSTAARLRAEADVAAARVATLSPREREVLDLIAEGLSIKEMATSLSVSPKSVETYRARLLEKLEAKTPSALMRIAVLVSLLTPPGNFRMDDEPK